MSYPTLYTSSACGNSYKVRLLAALLGIELQYEEVSLKADQQKSPEFLKINPRGEVPVLVHGDRILNDSSSILVYLAGTFGDDGKSSSAPSSFWSGDVFEQAQIVNWLSFANSWIQYGVFTNRAILSYNGPYNGLSTNDDWPQSSIDVFLKEGAIRGEKSLSVLEQQLVATGNWLVLERPTIADLGVFVYVALAPMGDISLEPYPQIREWIERIKGLKGFFGIEGLEDPMVHRK